MNEVLGGLRLLHLCCIEKQSVKEEQAPLEIPVLYLLGEGITMLSVSFAC